MSFKVLQVIPKLGYGGAETGCYDIAHYLAEKNCKSYILFQQFFFEMYLLEIKISKTEFFFYYI